MKTKPFLLATAGSTVDGRTIDDAMIDQMVSSYNPRTFGARLNIEHVRGMAPDGPFRAYGDVLELSAGTVEVDFNGQKEQRKALFGTFDVTEEARKLNESGQKVYPSIEIEPNFAGKGFAYLMGCALTDSPASIATQRLQFNRSLPGTLTLAGENAAARICRGHRGRTGRRVPRRAVRSDRPLHRQVEDRSRAHSRPGPRSGRNWGTGPAAALDFALLRPVLAEFATGIASAMAKEMASLRQEFRTEADALALQVHKLEAAQETTPAQSYRAQPLGRTIRGLCRDFLSPPRPPRIPSPQDLNTMGYNLSDRGRRALDELYSAIAQINGASRGVTHQFALDPTAEQRLEDLQRESVGFLQRINVPGVRDLTGKVIGLGAANMIASRRSRANLPRQPKYVGHMQERDYLLKNTLFDTWLPWEMIDSWSKFPDFPTRYARQVAISVALSRIAVGWHGTSAAPDTDADTNPLGEDVNIGWLHKLRLERADHVMGRETVTVGDVTTATGAAKPIYIGPDSASASGDYKNIDALAYDLIAGMPSWARSSTDHVVVVSQDLVDEKYFPMINRKLSDSIDGGKSTSDQVTTDIVMSTKQIGGRPAVIVPFFPEGTMLVTPLGQPGAPDSSNLSIYYQEGSRRRYIKDEPQNMAALVDYNSVNEGYVIESTDYAVMAENITFGARP
jgi:P2 family phage major capsid protein